MRAALIKFVATAALGWSLFARPDPDVAEGNRLYQEGKYSEAAAAYQKARPRDAAERRRIAFNRGTALLRAGEYGQAREPLREAQGDDDPKLRLAATFNEGNAAFMMKDHAAAVQAYRRALQVDPKFEAARRNLELALLAMEKPDASRPDGGPVNDGGGDGGRDAAQDAGPEAGNDGGSDGSASDSGSQGDGNRGGDSGGGGDGNGGDGNNQRGPDGGNQDGGAGDGGTSSQQQRRQHPEQREITEQDALRLLDSLRDAEQDRLLMKFLDREAQPEQVEKNW